MKINELYVGQSASISRRFTSHEVELFSDLCMDKNPVHLDEEYARNSVFGNRIVHGFLTASLISGIIGSILPGNGSIYLNQNMNFRKPVYHPLLDDIDVSAGNAEFPRDILRTLPVQRDMAEDCAVEGV